VIRKPAAILLVLSLAVLALALVPAAGLAAKGGGGGNSTAGGGKGGGGGGSTGGSSLALVMVDDVNGNGTSNWGDTVTFGVSTSSQVRLQCYQGGVRVYNANAAWYDGNPFAYMQYMKLQSGAWTHGAADCHAVNYYMSGKRIVTLATLDFHVDA
jgi:hypothetical protein